MTIAVTRLTPRFAARVDGADVCRPLDEETWSAIRAAFEEHSVLVFRGQPLDDERQIKRLMQRTTISGNPAELAPAGALTP